MFFRLIVLILLFPFVLSAKDIIVDLKEADYQDGIVTTSSGGVLFYDRMRIQAQNIRYVHEENVCAEGNLLVLFGQKIMAGKRLEYDFKKNCGVIEEGILTEFPCVIGAKKIFLLEDGSYELEESYITLCETRADDFSINSKKLCIMKNNVIVANDINLRFLSIPLFTISSLKTHASTLGEIPISASFTAGGVEGSYATLRYRLLTHEDLQVFLRADYVFNRGPGGGVDIDYCSKQNSRFFHGKNFMVRDRSYDNPDNRARYRFEGRYDECFPSENTEACLTYDFLSDSEMASDFSAKEFDLKTGRRTELLVNRKERNWMADFSTRVRVNSFQTVSQELPAVKGNFRPISIGSTGAIFDSRASAGYLNYTYASGTPNVSDFDATRIELDQTLYRPFHIGQGTTITPQAEFIGIFYGNNPNNRPVQQTIGRYGALATTSIHKYFGKTKHVIEPYVEYENWTFPSVPFNDYFVFTINDGYTGLQWLRFGVANSFYGKCGGCVKRFLYLNLWTYGFYNMHTMEKRVPKIYGSLVLDPLPYFSAQYDFAWNRETNSPDYVNLRHLWTINENAALNIDFLGRGPRAWRKADPTNFMIDAFLPEQVLLQSELSDRRNTFLAHIFYRFHPDWSAELESRYGWNRANEGDYLEWKFDLTTIVGCNWHLKLSYEHREIDNRFSISFKLGAPCPGRN